MRGCHELGERWTAKYSIVWQWDIGNVKGDLLGPVIQLAAKCYWQRDLSLRLAPSRIDPLKSTSFLELAVRDLKFLEHGG
jgi:hypothetical protein